MYVVLHVVPEAIQSYFIHETDVDDVCCCTRCTRGNIVVYTYIKETQTICAVLHVIHKVIQLYTYTQKRRRGCVLLYTFYTRIYSCMLIHKTDVDDLCCFARSTGGYIVVSSYRKQMQTMCVVVHVVLEAIQLFAHT